MKFNIPAPSFLKYEKHDCTKKTLAGGAQVYLYDLANLLLKEGHEVTVIQPWSKNETFEVDGIKVKCIKLPSVFKSVIEFGFFWMKHIDKDADKIHLHSYDLAFPFANDSMTATCHGVDWDFPILGRAYDKTIYEIWTPTLKRRYLKLRMRYAIRHLKKIISVDTFLLRYVQSEFPQFRDKIEVIPNYVNTELFNPKVNGSEIREKYADRTIILFPRNLSYNRGVHLSLESMKKLSVEYPDLLLLMTGYGPQKKWVLDYIQDNNLQKYIILMGHKDHFLDMPKIYAAVDIVIIPSFWGEGTSLSCLEAMATKKPVVVTNIGGLIDIVIDRYNGLICKPSSESLTTKIKLLLDYPILRARISDNALNWVKERHSYKNWTKAYKEFFEI